MKILTIFSVLFLFVVHSDWAQNDTLSPKRLYKIWVKKPEFNNKIKAVLFDVNDSSITLSDAGNKRDYKHGKYNLSVFPTPELDMVKIRRNKNMNRCALIGTGTGFVLFGVLITSLYPSTSDDSHQRTEDNLITFVSAGAWGALFGAVTGAIIGSCKLKIPINGSQGKFNYQKEKLKSYSVRYFSGKYPIYHPVKFNKLPDKLHDIDGNEYPVVALGGQVWMAANLKATHYSDGSEIISDSAIQNGNERLYGWEAVINKSGLCPAGWHIPSEKEWNSFLFSLGTTYPGSRMEDDFAPRQKVSHWWSSSEKDTVNAWSIYLNNMTIGVMIVSVKKTASLSIRCIRDN